MKGYIYTLSYETESNLFYVGSTTNPKGRLQSHRTKFGYLTRMDIVEEIEFNDIDELLLLEKFWNDQFKQWGFSLKNKDCYKRTLSYDKGVIQGCKEDYSIRIVKGIAYVKLIIKRGDVCSDLRIDVPGNEYNELKVKEQLRAYYTEIKRFKNDQKRTYIFTN